MAALKISSDFWTVYALAPFSTETAARTIDLPRGASEDLGATAGRIEIPEATAAAAAPAMTASSRQEEVCVERKKKIERG